MEEKIELCQYLKNYYEELGACIHGLSHGNEGLLSELPLWYMQYDIRIIYFQEIDFVKVFVNPLVNDRNSLVWVVKNKEEFNNIIPEVNDFLRQGTDPRSMAVMTICEEQYPDLGEIEFGLDGISMSSSQDDLSFICPIKSYRATVKKTFADFTLEKAKETALRDWQEVSRVASFLKTNRYDFDIKKTIDVFESMIHNTRFVERKVHRYLSEHAMIFLPSHKNCYFEKSFFDENGNETIADFVLEREDGLPALLIELESPHIKMNKKNGELSFEANHARNQISQWNKAIERNSENLKDEFSFLAGKRARLVIGGRGLYYLEDMKKTNSDDTTIWTYSLLIREAKIRWNKYFETQYKIIGINRSLPFRP